MSESVTDAQLEPAAAELRRSLSQRPRTVPPRWLYDDHGSELFDAITRLPEYYQTEAERQILADRSAHLAELTGATTVIELGSGTSDKTRTLLDAFVAHGRLGRFTPLDVSETTLLDAAAMLGERYPSLDVVPVVGDFTRHLDRLPVGGTRLVAFLGGTIGNFYRAERREFLDAVAEALVADDWLLLGVDLVKPVDRVLAAYDDSQGVTADFIRNALTVINRELGGDFDVANFDYVPLWDRRRNRVDMRLRAIGPERARIAGLDLDVELEAGEELRIEISTKFEPEAFLAELADFGFVDGRVFVDDGDDFGLLLVRRS